MSSFWWVDRCLPGVVASALWMPVWTTLLWLSHRKTRRHIDTVTSRQNEHIDALTARQTATLSGRDTQSPGGT